MITVLVSTPYTVPCLQRCRHGHNQATELFVAQRCSVAAWRQGIYLLALQQAPARGHCFDRVVIMGLLPVGAPGRHHRWEDRGGRRFGLQACHPERRSSVAGGAGHGLNLR